MNKQDSKGHAVVIAGSLAGLLAARVLSDHFDKVTIVEHDRYPQSPVTRKGVPQARHAHVLLVRGQQILEAFFPGVMDESANSAAPRIDAARDTSWLTPAGWACRHDSELTLLSASRNLLEMSSTETNGGVGEKIPTPIGQSHISAMDDGNRRRLSVSNRHRSPARLADAIDASLRRCGGVFGHIKPTRSFGISKSHAFARIALVAFRKVRVVARDQTGGRLAVSARAVTGG